MGRRKKNSLSSNFSPKARYGRNSLRSLTVPPGTSRTLSPPLKGKSVLRRHASCLDVIDEEPPQNGNDNKNADLRCPRIHRIYMNDLAAKCLPVVHFDENVISHQQLKSQRKQKMKNVKVKLNEALKELKKAKRRWVGRSRKRITYQDVTRESRFEYCLRKNRICQPNRPRRPARSKEIVLAKPREWRARIREEIEEGINLHHWLPSDSLEVHSVVLKGHKSLQLLQEKDLAIQHLLDEKTNFVGKKGKRRRKAKKRRPIRGSREVQSSTASGFLPPKKGKSPKRGTSRFRHIGSSFAHHQNWNQSNHTKPKLFDFIFEKLKPHDNEKKREEPLALQPEVKSASVRRPRPRSTRRNTVSVRHYMENIKTVVEIESVELEFNTEAAQVYLDAETRYLEETSTYTRDTERGVGQTVAAEQHYTDEDVAYAGDTELSFEACTNSTEAVDSFYPKDSVVYDGDKELSFEVRSSSNVDADTYQTTEADAHAVDTELTLSRCLEEYDAYAGDTELSFEIRTNSRVDVEHRYHREAELNAENAVPICEDSTNSTELTNLVSIEGINAFVEETVVATKKEESLEEGVSISRLVGSGSKIPTIAGAKLPSKRLNSTDTLPVLSNARKQAQSRFDVYVDSRDVHQAGNLQSKIPVPLEKKESVGRPRILSDSKNLQLQVSKRSQQGSKIPIAVDQPDSKRPFGKPLTSDVAYHPDRENVSAMSWRETQNRLITTMNRQQTSTRQIPRKVHIPGNK